VVPPRCVIQGEGLPEPRGYEVDGEASRLVAEVGVAREQKDAPVWRDPSEAHALEVLGPRPRRGAWGDGLKLAGAIPVEVA